MKSCHPRCFHGQNLFLGLLGILLVCTLASAQNLLRNPDFQEPLGTNNWTVEYIYGGPPDFSVADRTTIAHKDKVPGHWDGEPNYLNVFGAQFQPYHDGLMHAYFKQTVSGLKPGAKYVVSCWMVHFDKKFVPKAKVYLEALGGPDLKASRTTPYVTNFCNKNPSGWAQYAVTNTASAKGQIEVRLHFNKDKYSHLEWHYIRAYYDQAAVQLAE